MWRQSMELNYVGIDISKKTLDIAITEDGYNIKGTLKTSNNLKGFRDIHHWITSNLEDNYHVHICMESTGKYGEKLISYFQNNTDFIVSVCNPFTINAFGKSQLSRTKTDKADAALIARFAALMKPKTTQPIHPIQKEIKEKLRYLSVIKQEITSEKSKLDHYSDSHILAYIRSNISRLEKQALKLKNHILSLKDESPSLKQNHDLLVSIPGISTQTALTLLTEMIPQSPGSISRKAQTAHAGLAPSIQQSGTSVFSSKLTRYASPILKNALYFPTLSAIQNNPIISAFYLRLLKKGKPKMVAVVACMRKLLHICIGVLNNQRPFDPSFIPTLSYS